MDASRLSDAQSARGIEEDTDVLRALAKYQNCLASGRGLPKNDQARIQLMESNVKIGIKIRREIDELMADQGKRIGK
jgi:hypothetical protein